MALNDPSIFNGIAQSLIKAGIPAVVGMQFSIDVQAAAYFSEHFYASLARNASISEAMKNGRAGICSSNKDNQWYRPVLYTRWEGNEHGQLFNPTPSSIKSSVDNDTLPLIKPNSPKSFSEKAEANDADMAFPNRQVLQLTSPERMMPENIQSQLISLLDLQFSKALNVTITNEMMEDIAQNASDALFLLLAGAYVRIASDCIGQIRQLFGGQGDIRLSQFVKAQHMVNTEEACLRKICILLNHYTYLPENVTSQMCLQASLKATKALTINETLLQVIKAMQGKYPSQKKEEFENIKKQCTELIEVVKEIKCIVHQE